jgi:hypothetical protein
MADRYVIIVKTWPDPVLLEKLQDLGFFYDPDLGLIHYCWKNQIELMAEWLLKRRLAHEIRPANGMGELKKHPRLSDFLILSDGGSPIACALCGVRDVPCRLWVEGDDTDSIEYPSPARFYLCGRCVQNRMQPHPRLYAPADDVL